MAARVSHILDTSAWLIHLLREPGSERVTELFRSAENQVGIAVVSLPEIHGRLKSLGREREFSRIVDYYRLLITVFLPVTEAIALHSVELRSAASSRLPSIDSLIAATAALQGAVLVHRDEHFLSIPEDSLKQQFLVSDKRI